MYFDPMYLVFHGAGACCWRSYAQMKVRSAYAN